MKKFAFTLQRILDFKRTMYEKERNTLAQMRAERARLQDTRDHTEVQMMAMEAEFRRKAAEEGVRADEISAQAFHRENAGRYILQLEDELARKDIEIERQLAVVVELDKEVKSLEKLRESQWGEYVAETMREERENILEMVSQRFVENQRQADEQEAPAHREPPRRRLAS